jgi:hypothetical protein
MNLEGDDHSLIGVLARPPSGSTATCTKTSVSKFNVPVDTRTKHLPNMSQEHYRWAHQFGTYAFK